MNRFRAFLLKTSLLWLPMRFCLCSILFVFTATAVSAQTVPPCGQALASYKGIPAYSNGPDQWTMNECDPKNS